MDYKIYTRGIEYTNKFRKSVGKPIEKLLDEAPSDSFACGCIGKIGDVYSGVLRIKTTAAEFGALDVADNISDLMSKLSNNISSQLEVWRDLRFENESDTRKDHPSFANEKLLCLTCVPNRCPLNKVDEESKRVMRTSSTVTGEMQQLPMY